MENRLSERIKAVLPVSLRQGEGELPFGLEGEIVNISDTGSCIITNDRFEKGSMISVYLGDAERAIIRSNIVWRETPLNETYKYRYGVKFLEPYDRRIVSLKEKLRYEGNRLFDTESDIPHPETNLPSLPLSSRLLENLSPSSLSVDVTNVCNLKCRHCFWHSYKGILPTATNKDILSSVRKALEKYPSITNITWYGGEPLINRETRGLIEEGIKLRKNNLIVTNGTYPIPIFNKNTHFAVSIDGTEKLHDYLRGMEVYKKIKQNVLTAMEKSVPIAILYCLNALNIDSVSDFLEEWAYTKHIGIVFTTYSPMRGKSSSLTLTDRQREDIAGLLGGMKKKYGTLICNTEAMIELIRPKYGKDLAKNCPMNAFNKCGKIYSIHMCNDGSIRVPCALGKDVAHEHCRSVTKLALYAGKVLKDKKSYLALIRMYLSKPNARGGLERWRKFY